jgi:hypothetical protein
LRQGEPYPAVCHQTRKVLALAWGYTPYQVKGRRAPAGAPGPGLPKFLLAALCVCACVFIFAVVSEVLGTPGKPREKLLIRLDDGPDAKEELLVDPNSSWEQGEGKAERKFRILWKKPEKRDTPVSLWNEPEPAGNEQAGGASKAAESWDQVPGQEERPRGW